MPNYEAPEIRNDSSTSVEAAMKLLANNSVTISYGNLAIEVPARALEDARRDIAACSTAERPLLLASVECALRKSAPKIRSGRFSKKVADAFLGDMLLWEALKQ